MRRVRFLTLTVALLTLLAGLVALPATAATEVFDTLRVSIGSDETQGDGRSESPAISADGSTIVFESWATNLAPGDDNGGTDVFAYDVATGIITLISRSADGTPANSWSSNPSISADGGTIVYASGATDLIAGDTNGSYDIFAYDVATGTTTRVSVGLGGAETDGLSSMPDVSADGTVIAFMSDATNLVVGDTNGVTDVFVYEVATGTNTRVSVDSAGSQSPAAAWSPAISDDGQKVAFYWATAVGDVYYHDRTNSTTTQASVASNGDPADQWSFSPAISGDGNTVTFNSYASNLVTDPTNNTRHVYAHDVATGTTTLVSATPAGAPGDWQSASPAASSDGTLIAYTSQATDLITGDTNNLHDVYLTNTNTGTNRRITVGLEGAEPDGYSSSPAVSADGSVVAFYSEATNLVEGDTNGLGDVFMVDTGSGAPDPDYDPFDDDDGSVFEDDIEWLALSGITAGCGTRLFCPKLTVTRGQMAAFLTRALGLPEATQDWFDDDNTSIFEDDINRLAESGITKGCGTTTFCPNANVTRGQMAAFLVRAFGYTDDGGGNLFEDDDSSIFQGDIDKLATAGVTLGCNPPANTNFCPLGHVTREQMAAFLHRALE